jgi:hypothetical protein
MKNVEVKWGNDNLEIKKTAQKGAGYGNTNL